MRFFRLGGILLLLLTLTACANSFKMGPGLDKTSFRFSQAMRWQDYHGAASHVHPDVQEAFFELFPEDDDLRIVDSRILTIRVNEDQKTARADFQLEYYRLPSNSIKKWRWEQKWELVGEKATRPALWMVRNVPPPLP